MKKKTAVVLTALGLAASLGSAHAIEMFKADEVKPYQPSQRQEPRRAAPQRAEEQRPEAQRQERARPAKSAQGQSALSGLMGVWQTNVPGAVYQTPSSIPGYDRVHVSTGGPKGLLRILPGGTYSWNSYGGKTGRWVASGDPAYPIRLIDTVENKKWGVGFDPRRLGGREIIVSDGSIWYDGRR